MTDYGHLKISKFYAHFCLTQLEKLVDKTKHTHSIREESNQHSRK